MAVTIDNRPTVFGDRLIITGTYEATDTTIDLSAFLSEIDMAMCCLTGSTPGPAEAYTIDGTTISLTAAVSDGNFMAIGRRS
jgi:hypothetical protein